VKKVSSSRARGAQTVEAVTDVSVRLVTRKMLDEAMGQDSWFGAFVVALAKRLVPAAAQPHTVSPPGSDVREERAPSLFSDPLGLQQHFSNVRQQLAQVAGETGGLAPSLARVIVGKARRQNQAGNDLSVAAYRPQRGAREAQDADLGRVDDG